MFVGRLGVVNSFVTKFYKLEAPICYGERHLGNFKKRSVYGPGVAGAVLRTVSGNIILVE